MNALALLALLSATTAAQEVHSDGGRFLARVHAPGDIDVVPALEPNASPLWSVHRLPLAPANIWMLTDDGRALVGIAAHAEPSRPIVQVVREGKLLASFDATALSLAPDLEPDWLARGPCSLRLRSIERESRMEYTLDLLGRDFRLRRIDLETGMKHIGVSYRSTWGDQENRELRPVRVLPEGTVAFLQRTGGLAGSFEQVFLLEDGRVELSYSASQAGHFLASDDERLAVTRALSRLPVELAKTLSSGADDGYYFEFIWSSGGRLLRVQRDDFTLEPGLRALADALEGLAAGRMTTCLYRVDHERGSVKVRTTSPDLPSAPGREHRLWVGKIGSSMEVYPPDLSQSSVVLRIETGSLEVLDERALKVTTKEGLDFEKAMKEDVLEVSRFPAIEFKSRSVEVKPIVGNGVDSGEITVNPMEPEARSVEIVGALTLHGQTRSIRVPARIEMTTGELRATGTVRFKLTDFGISAGTIGAGSVRVADEVEIAFDLFAEIGAERSR